MRDLSPRGLGPITFSLTWLDIGVVVVLVVGLLAGLVRGDVSGTLGPVVTVGLTLTAVGIVVALMVPRRR